MYLQVIFTGPKDDFSKLFKKSNCCEILSLIFEEIEREKNAF